MEIAITVILLMLSEYTQRNQSIDTTGWKASYYAKGQSFP